MNYIVTGGCGFIGSHLVNALLVLGHKVLVIDDLRSGKTIFKHEHKVQYIHDEVCSIQPEGHFHGIFHLANTPRVRLAMEKPVLALRNNIDPTIHVADWAKRLNCPLFFATSSSTIYSDKMSNPYTMGKAVSEEILEMYGKLYNIYYRLMYFYNVYGPREADYGPHSTVVRSFKKAVINNEALRIFGTGKKTRDFTHVDDVIDGILAALFGKEKSKQIHFGSGNPYSILDVANAFDHPIIHEFDRPGEAQDTLCKRPYVKVRHNVLDYIKFWKQEYTESQIYFNMQAQLKEIDHRHAESSD